MILFIVQAHQMKGKRESTDVVHISCVSEHKVIYL